MSEEMKVNEVEEKKLSMKEKGGLEYGFKHDPTLETHFKKVLAEVIAKNKK